jgi:uncharacterized membrane protein
MAEERVRILKMVEAGTISAEQAVELLAALESEEPEGDAEVIASTPLPATHSEEKWARFWIYPLLVGGVVLIVGSLIVALVYATDAARGWLVCGWLPLGLGLVIMLLAWWARRARWLHLRISEGGRRKVALSFPLPLTLVAWGLSIAQSFVPQLKETGVDDLLIALRDSATHDTPFFVDVQDEQDGERVQVYIG